MHIEYTMDMAVFSKQMNSSVTHIKNFKEQIDSDQK